MKLVLTIGVVGFIVVGILHAFGIMSHVRVVDEVFYSLFRIFSF